MLRRLGRRYLNIAPKQIHAVRMMSTKWMSKESSKDRRHGTADFTQEPMCCQSVPKPEEIVTDQPRGTSWIGFRC